MIQAGTVEIRRRVGDSERVLAVLPPGEFFGEMALINARPRSATAVVRDDARLLVIESRTFEAMLRGRSRSRCG
ncbi:MAG: cyclic nucleotide-binding domain-containing protein [Myxococcales bacterium]|nr:cyclic nucleotide-binding domain-containing protein [Myxococcales bacterium]